MEQLWKCSLASILSDMARIYVDADSITARHRAIILRRAIGKEHSLYFVADRSLSDVEKAIADDKSERRRRVRDEMTREEARKIGSEIHMIVVQSGKDSADDEIVRIAEPMSLAITHDIPLSKRLIEKGLTVIDDRGGRLDSSNIDARLSERRNNMIFREMGLFDSRQKRFDERTIQEFAAAFDKALSELA